jgi:hypothetical protein
VDARFGQPDYQVAGTDGKPMTYADAKDLRLHNTLAGIRAGAPRVLFTVNTKTREQKDIFKEREWLEHLQFSPSDPTLIMFCHEGTWHEADRIWTIRTDGTGLKKIRSRTMNMEIAVHEFFSADGSIIWYDLQTPRGQDFWLAGYKVQTGSGPGIIRSAMNGPCISMCRRTGSYSQGMVATVKWWRGRRTASGFISSVRSVCRMWPESGRRIPMI